MTIRSLFLSLLFFPIIALQANANVEVGKDGFYVDGKYFYPIGVNYMPRDSAIYLWKEFDPAKIDQEFKVMREMGLNCFRTFAFWADLNPEPGKIDQQTLEELGKLLDLAQSNGLKVILTINTGHMSGENWYPEWMGEGDKDAVLQTEPILMFQMHLPHKSRSIYEDPRARENGLLQARTLAARFKDHPALLYYDLANENQYWQKPRTPELAQKYVDALVKEIKKYDPNHPVAIGMGKFAENTGFRSFGKWGLNAVEDLYIDHTYPAGYFPASAKTVDQYSTWYAGFENNLSRVSGLAAQFQEFGLSKSYLAAMSADEQKPRLAGYYRDSLWGAVLGGANAGALGWCFADFAPSLANRRPYNTHSYELYFGVVDREYNLKASGEELKRFSGVMKEVAPGPLEPRFDPVAIVLPENYLENPAGTKRPGAKFKDDLSTQNKFLFSAYLIARQLGINPIFLSADQDFSGAKLFVLSNFVEPSAELAAKLKSAEANGSVVYVGGDREIENALRPSDKKFAELRAAYQALLDQARIKPAVKADESFVETGILNDKYLAVINHLDRPVKTKISFPTEAAVSRCFYGKTPMVSAKAMEMQLQPFGVEVCEAKF